MRDEHASRAAHLGYAPGRGRDRARRGSRSPGWRSPRPRLGGRAGACRPPAEAADRRDRSPELLHDDRAVVTNVVSARGRLAIPRPPERLLAEAVVAGDRGSVESRRAARSEHGRDAARPYSRKKKAPMHHLSRWWARTRERTGVQAAFHVEEPLRRRRSRSSPVAHACERHEQQAGRSGMPSATYRAASAAIAYVLRSRRSLEHGDAGRERSQISKAGSSDADLSTASIVPERRAQRPEAVGPRDPSSRRRSRPSARRLPQLVERAHASQEEHMLALGVLLRVAPVRDTTTSARAHGHRRRVRRRCAAVTAGAAPESHGRTGRRASARWPSAQSRGPGISHGGRGDAGDSDAPPADRPTVLPRRTAAGCAATSASSRNPAVMRA